MKIFITASCFVLVLLLSVPQNILAVEKIGPLISVTPKEFIKLPEEYQLMYVAGYIDSATFISYGYSFPDHEELVSCFRSMPLGDFTKKVVNWLRNNPKHKEGMASAIAHTTGEICKKKTNK